jgi:predicted amidohydrolase YtcJ
LLPGFVDAHTHLLNEGDLISLADAQSLALANGITSHANMFTPSEVLSRVRQFAAAGKLRVRTSLYLLHNTNCGEPLGPWYLAERPVTDPRRMLRVPGVKIFADGGSCGRPAVSWTYPNGSGGDGDLWIDADSLAQAVSAAQARGFQVAVHALGDRAVDVALEGIRRALSGGANRLRHRIEHAALVRQDQLRRFGEVGAIPVLFGAFGTCAFNAGRFGRADLLTETAPYLWRWREIVDANPGLPVAWHVDWPVFPEQPFVHLYSLSTRRELTDSGGVCRPQPEQANDTVSRAVALRMMTMGSAYALGIDSAVGSITVGKLADLVIVSANPLAVQPDAIPRIRVLSTIVGGRTRFCAKGVGGLCPR